MNICMVEGSVLVDVRHRSVARDKECKVLDFQVDDYGIAIDNNMSVTRYKKTASSQRILVQSICQVVHDVHDSEEAM